MDTEPGRSRPARPAVVTIAAVIWLVDDLLRFVGAAPGMLSASTDAGTRVGGVIALVFLVAWTVLFVWLAVLMARGSSRARLALGVFAGLAAVTAGITVATTGPSWSLIWVVSVVVAGVLSYLPSTRGFFPTVPPRPRRVEPRTIGWDPETGERITEDAEHDAR